MKRLILFALLCTAPAFGQVTAASCSVADITSAWASVNSGTTTFTIPSGSCTWTGNLSLSVPSGANNLTVQGSTTVTGNCSPSSQTCTASDGTTIIDNDTADNNGRLLSFSNPNSGCTLFRVTGLSIKAGTGAVKYAELNVSGSCPNVRIDHNNIDFSSSGQSSSLILTSGSTFGSIDHNVIKGAGGQQGIWTWNESYGPATTCNGGAGCGDGSWNAATNWGTANFVDISNNAISGTLYANDCTRGGRQVFRYNVLSYQETQTHPTGGSGRFRGCRAIDENNNLFNGNPSCNSSGGFGNCTFNFLFLSSGTAMIWGNNFPSLGGSTGSGLEYLISIHNVRSDNSDYSQSATPNGWGYCGTAQNGTGSGWDYSSSTSSGYPCMDQPGRGVGDLLQGGFSSDSTGSNNVCDTTTHGTGGSCGGFGYNGSWVNEALEPVYEWMDTWTPVPSNPYSVFNNYEPSTLSNNRDYYAWCNSNAQNQSGCSSFNGTVGTGSGLLSARPGTCTTGVGYWATDTSTLYQCSSTNTWSSYYTPYTYPNPLTGGSSYTFSVASSGTGSCSFSGTSCSNGTYTSGTSISCTATPAAGSTFTGWSGTGSASGCSGTGACAFSLTSNSTATATCNLQTGSPFQGVKITGAIL